MTALTHSGMSRDEAAQLQRTAGGLGETLAAQQGLSPLSAYETSIFHIHFQSFRLRWFDHSKIIISHIILNQYISFEQS